METSPNDARTENIAEKVALDISGAGNWAIPQKPEPRHWEALALLRLRARLNSYGNHFNRAELAFKGELERLALHPLYKGDAEKALLAAEKNQRRAELEAMQAELASIKTAEWGLTDRQEKAALIVGGLAPAKTGVGVPNFDQRREQAALELEIGALSLAGYLQDVRRQRDLEREIEALQSELASMGTATEQAARDRKARVEAAKRERAALSKRVAPGAGDFDKETYKAERKLKRDMGPGAALVGG